MAELSRNEYIKEASDYLRGTLAEGLADEITGGIVEDDQQLVKFHGMYLQDDRDLRAERGRKKMEKAFSFMIRVRIPGGALTPQQWLTLDEIATKYANGTMRITTRQTIQLHGVIKSNLKPTMARIDAALLTTIAACGDVNRNVICNPNPHQSRAYGIGHCKAAEVVAVAEAVVTVQRDWGARSERKHSRLKFTIEDRGLEAFRAEVEKRSGVKLGKPKPYQFTSTGDRYGWTESEDGRAHLTLFIENG